MERDKKTGRQILDTAENLCKIFSKQKNWEGLFTGVAAAK